MISVTTATLSLVLNALDRVNQYLFLRITPPNRQYPGKKNTLLEIFRDTDYVPAEIAMCRIRFV